MGIKTSQQMQNLRLQRENAALKNKVAKQKEMLEFLGILNDVDLEDLMDDEGAMDNGEE